MTDPIFSSIPHPDDPDPTAISDWQKSLRLDNHFCRSVLTVYWDDAAPSTEVFYMHEHFNLTAQSISAVEQKVLALMAANSSDTPTRAIYVSDCGAQLQPEDIASAGWRVIVI